MISLSEYILNVEEARIVPFGNTGSSARFGQCIILAGGSGIGKGYVRKTYLNADYKVFNVDDLKYLYIKLKDKKHIDDKHDYDFKNGEDMNMLHKNVAARGWKQKQRDMLFKNANTDRLPNVCFDITCKSDKELSNIINYVKPLGYTITLVWVVGNVDVAVENNNKRARSIPEAKLREIHAMVNSFLPELLSNKHKDLSDNIDAAYIALSAGMNRTLGDEWKNSPVLPVPKKDNDFDYVKVKNKVDRFISEKQPVKR